MAVEQVHSLWQDRFGRREPGKIVCVGLNYHDHAAEQGVELPEEPLLFAKFANTQEGRGARSSCRPRVDTWTQRLSSRS